jgi:hypothetical protein
MGGTRAPSTSHRALAAPWGGGTHVSVHPVVQLVNDDRERRRR